MSRAFKNTINLIAIVAIVMSGLGLSQRAEAVVPVSVVGTVIKGSVDQTASNTMKTASLLQELWQKEYVEDPAKWGENKAALEKMTAEYVEYINSGFNGSPVFVTNYERFVEDISDRLTFDFITSSDLDGLSDAFEFKTRVALLNNYIKSKDYKLKSTLDEITDDRTQDFLEGNYDGDNYWEAWRALTEGEYNDPLVSLRVAEEKLAVKTLDTIANEKTQLDWGSGFITTRYCEVTTNSEGGEERQCVNTTPPAVTQAAASHILGVLPAEIILAGDELNETIDETYKNLTKQVITGENGLLGLGASPLSVNVYGEDGQSSYLNVLSRGSLDGPNTFYNPIQQSLDAEIDYAGLQQQVINAVTLLENKLASSTDAYPDCFDLELTSALKDDKDTATAALEASLTVREILELLNNSFINAPDQVSANAVLEQYNILKAQGLFTTDLENQTFVNQFLNTEFKDRVASFNGSIDTKIQQCEAEENRGGGGSGSGDGRTGPDGP